MSTEKQDAVRKIGAIAGAFRQPVLTGEDSRYGAALGMIREITEWALHPAWGNVPPFAARMEHPVNGENRVEPAQ